MNNLEKTLEILIKNKDYISGEEIAKRLNCSRNAVWKNVKTLKSKGYDILSVTNKGYLLENKNLLNGEEISRYLVDKDKWNILVLEEVESTNSLAKEMEIKGEKTNVYLAENQKNGKGRLNRKFVCSKNKGIYLSVVLKPNLLIKDSIKITTYSAVIVAKAIEKLCLKPVEIKWVNDLFMGGKKICGILTEATCDFESNKLNFAVLGIGINVLKTNFDESLTNIATDIYSQSGVEINRNLLVAEILNGLNNLEKEILKGEYLSIYKEKSLILNKEVIVESGESRFIATAIDINDSGALIVKKGEGTLTINAGDVSLRLKV